MKFKDIASLIEAIAPPVYQEPYDNSGLLLGNPEQDIKGVLLCLDCTEAVVDEAIAKGLNFILAHHPLIFKGVRRLNGKTDAERALMKAIRHDIGVYAAHTNLDNVLKNGVNSKFASKLGLENLAILKPRAELLDKLVVYVPEAFADTIKTTMFEAGAGSIGHYSECSFSMGGIGSFTPGKGAVPYTGIEGVRETTDEMRVEVISPRFRSEAVIAAVKAVHPYEEMAFDIIPLRNVNRDVGSGMVGELPNALDPESFLKLVKNRMNTPLVKHTAFSGMVKRVALCGGAGSFLIDEAIRAGADAFVTSDVKYHEFFDANQSLMFCDIGHYESEISTLEVFYEVIREKMPNFAVNFCETNTNPIQYYK